MFRFTGAQSTSGVEAIPLNVAELVIHDQYIHNQLLRGFDIALIRLDGILNIPFAHLPVSGTPLPGGECLAAGKYGTPYNFTNNLSL